MKHNKRKSNLWQTIVIVAAVILMGIICGRLIDVFIYTRVENILPFDGFPEILCYLICICIGGFIHIIIHETGHLIFGLLSGYSFSSFRIFSFMWLKENGKLRLKRQSIAGTGGQCIMIPPDMVDGKFPVVLYNLGGILLNAVSSIVFLALFFLCLDFPILAAIMLWLFVLGVLMAVMNGVPTSTGSINNDGYNAMALSRDPEAMEAFWIQLRIVDKTTKGLRLKQMPAEWFKVPSDEGMKNSMTASRGVFACNRLMDEGRYQEADSLMEHILGIDSGIVGLHRSLLICDRICLELMYKNRRDVVEKMQTEEQKNFMKAMKKFLPVLRTNYLIAMFMENDMTKADKIMTEFEKQAKLYPYETDIASERELIRTACKIYGTKDI